MANTKYEVRELRMVVEADLSHLYVLCGPDNEGGVLVGGWYHKVIPASVPVLDAMTEAMRTQDYLLWNKGAPK